MLSKSWICNAPDQQQQRLQGQGHYGRVLLPVYSFRFHVVFWKNITNSRFEILDTLLLSKDVKVTKIAKDSRASKESVSVQEWHEFFPYENCIKSN